VNINWIFKDLQDKKETKALIDREFELRTMISKLFMNDSFLEGCDDFDFFELNYHVATGKLTVSSKTPEPYYSKIKRVLKRHPLIYDTGL